MGRHSRLRFAVTSFCLGMIGLHLIVIWLARDQIRAGLPDFRIFYTAGLMLRRGQGGILYNDEVQLKTQREFVPAALRDNGPLPFNHPPFEAALYVPLTYLAYFRAYLTWFALNLVLLAGTVYLIRHWLPTLEATFPLLVFLIPLAFFPVAYALMQGQDSILLLALYALAYAALRRERDLQAGMFLGLGLFKFHLVLPFAFVLLVCRRWRACFGVLITAFADMAVSWALVGWKELLFYPRYTWQIDRLQPARIIEPKNMPNLRGLLTGWPNIKPGSHVLGAVLLAVSLCVLVWAAKQWRDSDSSDAESWDTGFSVALVATFLVGYHGYNQDMSMLLIPALIAFERVLRRDSDERVRRLKIVLVLLFLSPMYLILTLHLFHQNLFALVLVAFAGCLVASSTPSSVDVTSSGKVLAGAEN